MGSYLNPGNKGFRESINSRIYVDKTGLIEETNAVLNTQQKYLCVSRPRRFGKSMAADMLAAYYDRSVNSEDLFGGFAISRAGSYREHLNRYHVIQINMQEFLSVAGNVDEMLKLLQARLPRELKWEYPEDVFENSLIFSMKDIYAHTGCAFVILSGSIREPFPMT